MPSNSSFLRPAALLLGMACLPAQAQPNDFGGYGPPAAPPYDRQALRSCAEYGYRVSRGACAGGWGDAREGWRDPRDTWGGDPDRGTWGGADGWGADPGFAERGARPLRRSGMESRWPPWEEPAPARSRPSPWLVGPSGASEPPPPRAGRAQGRAWGPPAQPWGEAEWGPRPQPEAGRWQARPRAESDWGAQPRPDSGWGRQAEPSLSPVPSQPGPQGGGDWETTPRAEGGWDAQMPPPAPSQPERSVPATGMGESAPETAAAAADASAPAGEAGRDYFWGEVKPPRRPPQPAPPPASAGGTAPAATPFGMLPDPWAGSGAAAKGPSPDAGSAAAPAEQADGTD